MVLNAEVYSPSSSNPSIPCSNDPLFFDFIPQIDTIKKKLEAGEIDLAKYQDFVRILTECKLNLKDLNQVFENINKERLEYRTWIVKILLNLIKWKTDGNFYSGVETMFKDIGITDPIGKLDFLTLLGKPADGFEEFGGMKILSSRLSQVNYELIKNARDRLEINLEKVERELF